MERNECGAQRACGCERRRLEGEDLDDELVIPVWRAAHLKFPSEEKETQYPARCPSKMRNNQLGCSHNPATTLPSLHPPLSCFICFSPSLACFSPFPPIIHPTLDVPPPSCPLCSSLRGLFLYFSLFSSFLLSPHSWLQNHASFSSFQHLFFSPFFPLPSSPFFYLKRRQDPESRPSRGT